MHTFQLVSKASSAIDGTIKINQELLQSKSFSLFLILCFVLNIIITSGLFLKANRFFDPIFFDKINQSAHAQMPAVISYQERQKNFALEINKKYKNQNVNFVDSSIAHIKTTKYLNGQPIKVNIAQIDPNASPNIIIKPEMASGVLNSKAQISTIAKKDNALLAINASYFKPQTGVPLGALVIDNKVLSGPIYNRVGIGIEQQGDKTSFVMDRVYMYINIDLGSETIKADNINQPRMLSTYTLIYTPDWGEFSPIAPQYGKNIVIEQGKIISISDNEVKIPKNGFVISAPSAIVDKIKNKKDIKYTIKMNETFKNSKHIIGAGPYLVKNGEVYVDITAQKFGAITGKNPRSAVGFTKDNELILVTIDGREKNSVGADLFELARIMKNLGCTYAMNLDGGGSSVMYVNDKIVNNPAQKGGIYISNALVVSSEIQQ